jgi:hypothetical protein
VNAVPADGQPSWCEEGTIPGLPEKYNESSGGLEDGPKKMAESAIQVCLLRAQQDKELDDLKSFFEPEESQLIFPSKSDIIFFESYGFIHVHIVIKMMKK